MKNISSYLRLRLARETDAPVLARLTLDHIEATTVDASYYSPSIPHAKKTQGVSSLHYDAFLQQEAGDLVRDIRRMKDGSRLIGVAYHPHYPDEPVGFMSVYPAADEVCACDTNCVIEKFIAENDNSYTKKFMLDFLKQSSEIMGMEMLKIQVNLGQEKFFKDNLFVMLNEYAKPRDNLLTYQLQNRQGARQKFGRVASIHIFPRQS